MKKINKKEVLIHIKLENSEATISKRDILRLEIELLKLIKAIKRYRAYRTRELIEKNRLKIKISGMLKDIKRTELALPRLEIPKILKGSSEKEYEKEYKKPLGELQKLSEKIEEKQDDELEQQLREIQLRLQTLQ